jgi:hypothetical protein
MAVEAIAKVPCITAEVKSETTAAVTEENQNCDSKVCVSKTDVGDANKALYAQVKKYGNLFAKDASSNESLASVLVAQLRDRVRDCRLAGPEHCENYINEETDIIIQSLVRLGADSVPELTTLLRMEDVSIYEILCVCKILFEMGPVAAPAVDALIETMRDDRYIEDEGSFDRGFARRLVDAGILVVFAKIGPAAAPAAPVIIETIIKNQDDYVLEMHVQEALTAIGPAATLAINDALENEDLDEDIRQFLDNILYLINSEI